ncbi:MAG: alanine--tRNA ligase, partial [Bacteroidales bacterium]
HVDIRSEEERRQVPGSSLINTGHPLVIEIWNLVFIQYNRKSDGQLELLPQKHVDTGMGFERLCMALQGKRSNYDTDLFQPLIATIAAITGKVYGNDSQADVAMRVIADHIRAIAFSIADGQLPSNTGAGYVIRRILRRAVRYAFTFLDKREPFMAGLVPVLAAEMGDAFPELAAQQQLIATVVTEEEAAFLRTLDTGISRLEQLIADQEPGMPVSGKAAFELYDTFGFPLDLTQLILSEKKLEVDLNGFQAEMEKQKSRSRQAGGQEAADWIILREGDNPLFTGYDELTAKIRITRYRQVRSQKSAFYQLVFDRTPFYAESGGQVGDTGTISGDGETIQVIDTRKENNLIVHITNKLPSDPKATFTARVTEGKRLDTMRNHTATHLLHHALRHVLGPHVEQKGSLVHPDYLRFDFSHYHKMTQEETEIVELMVNQLIRENIHLAELRDIPMEEAREMGAMALFGEKYGDRVRVIRFGNSVELCGGTHVNATGQIGFFRIQSESSIAAGIRRIEAWTGTRAETEARENARLIQELSGLLKTGKGLAESVILLQEEAAHLRKKIESFAREQLKSVKRELAGKARNISGVSLICERVALDDQALVKDLAFQMKGEMENLFLIIGTVIDGKPSLSVMISDNLVKAYGLNAGAIVRESAREMEGGGGGQPFFATAGGKNPDGLDKAMARAVELLKEKL